MTINKDFKKYIDKVKFEFDLKQREIASRIGIHNSYLSDMINGRVPVTKQVSDKIYELFHINVNINLEQDEYKNQEEQVNRNEIKVPDSEKFKAHPDELFLCPECINKKRVIDAQAVTIASQSETIASLKEQIKLFEFCLGKNRSTGSE